MEGDHKYIIIHYDPAALGSPGFRKFYCLADLGGQR